MSVSDGSNGSRASDRTGSRGGNYNFSKTASGQGNWNTGGEHSGTGGFDRGVVGVDPRYNVAPGDPAYRDSWNARIAQQMEQMVGRRRMPDGVGRPIPLPQMPMVKKPIMQLPLPGSPYPNPPVYTPGVEPTVPYDSTMVNTATFPPFSLKDLLDRQMKIQSRIKDQSRISPGVGGGSGGGGGTGW